MITRFKLLLSSLILVACSAGYCQLPPNAPASPVSITIRSLHDVISAGARLKVMADVTNHSKAMEGGGEGDEIHWEVRASSGAIIPEKESYIKERFQATTTRLLPPTVISIPPGETRSWSFVITDMYDLSEPDQYTIRAQRRSFDDSTAVATSNAITVTVIPAQTQPATDLPQASFSLEINVEPAVVKAGSPLSLSIEATDTAQHDINLSNNLASFSFEIHDSRGAEPDLTDAGSLLKKLQGKKGDHPIHLIPGETKSLAGVNLQQLYNLTQPGEYSVQVSQMDEETKTLVKSNVITITVNPQ